jgi:outer membrane protein OmpA-like peptidoglycan-associated protein
MRTIFSRLDVLALTVFAFVGVATLSQAQEAATKVKGLIVGRDGPNMIVKTEMAQVTFALSDDTKVESIKGVFGLRKDTLALTDLVPGLPVEVEGSQIGGQLTATKVKFKADDLKTARQISAGLAPTNEQVANMQGRQSDLEGKQTALEGQHAELSAQQASLQKDQAELSAKFGQLGDYDVKGEATVYFPVNGTSLSDESKQQLKSLADNAVQLKGYMIQVAGYTDSSGNATYNQELSDKRADAVVNYLQQECKVPLYRVLAPEGMGESNPAGTNESQAGKSQNRRVEVKVLVNRGVSSSSSGSTGF